MHMGMYIEWACVQGMVSERGGGGKRFAVLVSACSWRAEWRLPFLSTVRVRVVFFHGFQQLSVFTSIDPCASVGSQLLSAFHREISNPITERPAAMIAAGRIAF